METMLFLTLSSIFDAPQGQPSSWYAPMSMPLLLAFFGGAIWVLGRLNDTRTGKKSWFKYLGLLLAGYALVTGFAQVLWLRDVMYGSIVNDHGKKMIFAHWISFLFPLFVLLGSVGWYLYDRRNENIR